MSTPLAYCGLVCQSCPIYVATRQQDIRAQAKMRIDIARTIRALYGLEYAAEDITDCDGCTTEGGRLFEGCRRCAIRACARRNHYQNCACCSRYACDKLESVFAKDAAARARLNAIRLDAVGS
jgi:hypothetical protein